MFLIFLLVASAIVGDVHAVSVGKMLDLPGKPQAEQTFYGYPLKQEPSISWSRSGVTGGDNLYELNWCDKKSFSNCSQNVNLTSESNYKFQKSFKDGDWYFRVRALDRSGNASPYSTVGRVQINSEVPKGPSRMSAYLLGDKYELDWIGCWAEKYKVYRSVESPSSGFVEIATVDRNEPKYFVDSYKKSWVYVVALDYEGNESNPSNVLALDPVIFKPKSNTDIKGELLNFLFVPNYFPRFKIF